MNDITSRSSNNIMLVTACEHVRVRLGATRNQREVKALPAYRRESLTIEL